MTAMVKRHPLRGERHEIALGEAGYPEALSVVERPPVKLYVVGDPAALQEGLAVVGARRATPYGIGCARHFAGAAARRGIVIISGGARGCDAVAHEAALAAGTPTVAFLGGGCDEIYPAENAPLFQRIVDAGGAVVSENEWGFRPLPYTFRERNRLIAGLAKATLIVEAGLPSGTFSTADEALSANREVLVVPGCVTSPSSRGANRLIYQGATPIVDDETFEDQLFALFGCLRQETAPVGEPTADGAGADGVRQGSGGAAGGRASAPGGRGGATSDAARRRSDAGWREAGEFAHVLDALQAQPLGMEELRGLVVRNGDAAVLTRLMVWLATAQRDGLIAQYPDGRYGPSLAHARL